MRACVTSQSSSFVCSFDGWLLSVSAAAIDMDATKSGSAVSNICRTQSIQEWKGIFPNLFCKDNANSVSHQNTGLVSFGFFPLFLLIKWKNNPVSLSQNLQGKIHFRSPPWAGWIEDPPLGRSAYSLHCSHSSKIMNHVSQDLPALESYHWLR